MRSKVYIRVDGNAEIGLGHLVRCFALAHMLKPHFDVTFICIDIVDNIKTELDNSNFELYLIKQNDDLFDIIKPLDIIVLDGYHFNAAYQKKIKALDCILIFVDDLHDKNFYADLIINHSPAVHPSDYLNQCYTQFALGVDYALLRPVFLKQAQKKRIVKEIDTVFICFGGADYLNLTKNTLLIVQNCNIFKKIIVVTGSAYKFEDTLKIYKEKNKTIEHHHIVDEQQMLNLMLEADLAIVPASGIFLEVLAVGCIVISGIYTDNQKLIYSNYKKLGCFVDASDFNNKALTKALKSINNLKNNIPSIIDGHSGERILKRFIQLELKNKIKLRLADIDDMNITYKWAVDPNIRAYSFNQHLITRSEHQNWFLAKLKDNNCFYFIGEMDNERIGCLRFDIYLNEAIISYLVDSEYIGKGLGQNILALGIEQIENIKKKLGLDFQRIVGYVMKENIASINIFEKMNFIKFEEADKLKFERLIS